MVLVQMYEPEGKCLGVGFLKTMGLDLATVKLLKLLI